MAIGPQASGVVTRYNATTPCTCARSLRDRYEPHTCTPGVCPPPCTRDVRGPGVSVDGGPVGLDDEPGAAEFDDVLAEDLAGLGVADVEVQRVAAVGHLRRA